MAQPPDSGEIFLREVDENLRRDQIRDLAKRYGGWMIAGMVLFLVAVGGWLLWQQHQATKAAEATEELSQIFSDIGAGNTRTANSRLQTLSHSGSKALRGSAVFARAALALQQNDSKSATALYKEIAGDGGLPAPYRDLALIRQTAIEFDSLKPEQVVARLQPLAKPGNPWFGSAGEMTAMAYIKQGKRLQAGRLFAALAADGQVPDSIRARSVQIAGSLGVDASAALPAAAQ